MSVQWQSAPVGAIQVEFQLSPGLIQVRNASGEVARHLRGSVRATARAMAAMLAEQYRRTIGRPLDVAQRSLALELWLHAVADSVGRLLAHIPGARRLGAFVVARTCTIDMGESTIDPNRYVWDLLARLLPWW